jgi:hypothetical protein
MQCDDEKMRTSIRHFFFTFSAAGRIAFSWASGSWESCLQLEIESNVKSQFQVSCSSFRFVCYTHISFFVSVGVLTDCDRDPSFAAFEFEFESFSEVCG